MNRKGERILEPSVRRDARIEPTMRCNQFVVPVESGWTDVLVEVDQSVSFQRAENFRVQLLQLRDVMRGLMKEDDVVGLGRQSRLIEIGHEIVDAAIDPPAVSDLEQYARTPANRRTP